MCDTEVLKRLFCPSSIASASAGEARLLEAAGVKSEMGAKYLAQRKTLLTAVILTQLGVLASQLWTQIVFIRNLNNASEASEASEASASFDARPYGNILIGLLVVYSAYAALVVALVIVARRRWPSHEASSRYLVAGYALKVLLPAALFFVPYDNLVAAEVSVYIYGGLVSFAVAMIMPDILTVQTITMRSNDLTSSFVEVRGFRVVFYAMMMFYIPAFIVLCGIAFQYRFVENAGAGADGTSAARYDMRIFPFMAVYLAYLLAPNQITEEAFDAAPACCKRVFGTAPKLRAATRAALCIPTVVLLYFIARDIKINLFTNFAVGYLESTFLGVAISDALIRMVKADVFGEPPLLEPVEFGAPDIK